MLATDDLSRKFTKFLKNPDLLRNKARSFVKRISNDDECLKLIQGAFSHPNGYEHTLIKGQLACAYGLRGDGNRSQAKRFVEDLLLTIEVSHRKWQAMELPQSPIGFGDISIHCDTKDRIEVYTYLFGFYDELAVLRTYAEMVSPGTTAIDVGGHVGIHSMALAKIVGQDGRVIAFEPNGALVKKFYKNLKSNSIGNVYIHVNALGDSNGDVGYAEAEFNVGASHLSDAVDSTVPVVCLDSLIEEIPGKVSLIKIDVEGAEQRVIIGSRSVLERHRPMLVVEYIYPPWKLSELLSSLPYATKVFRLPNDLTEMVVDVNDERELPPYNNLLIVPATA